MIWAVSDGLQKITVRLNRACQDRSVAAKL
nr:MAG TPA: hypothetical protein [Caudoviricetes sp.]